MTKSKILAQGSYGCVYYPGYTCNGKEKEKLYVSKLSRNDTISQNEYSIGKLIKKIPNYSKRFIVIEKKCKVKKNKLDTKECDFIKKGDYPYYLLLYSKYLNSIELHSILYDGEINYYKLLEITYTIYKRITELYSVGVIHMDLHFANILVSKKNGNLYVIDFGLALDSNQFFKEDKLNLTYINEKWFNYRTDLPYWTLEYIFISLIVKEKEELNKINILSTITEYYDYNKVIHTLLDKNYIKIVYDYYKSFENNSRETNLKLLLQYSNTWDYYKLAYHILSYMNRKSIVFDELKWLLLLMIHPIPEFRPTKDELKEHFKNYLEVLTEYKDKQLDKSDKNDIIEDELIKSIKEIIKINN